MRKIVMGKHHRRSITLVDKKSLREAIQQNRPLLLFAAAFLLGLGLGAVFSRGIETSALQKMDFLFNSNFQNRAQQSFFALFSASFASAFVFVFACFLCGLSMWGMIIIPVVLLFRGFGLGITSGYLYASFGFQGILFNALVILPGAFLCCLSLLFAAREGALFSRKIGSGEHPPVKIYVVRYGVILALAFASSLLDAATNFFFSGWFSFK